MTANYNESQQYNNANYSYSGTDLVWDNSSISYDSITLSYDDYPLRTASGSAVGSSTSSGDKFYTQRTATSSGSGSSSSQFAYLKTSSVSGSASGSASSTESVLIPRGATGSATGGSNTVYDKTNRLERQVAGVGNGSHTINSNSFVPSVSPWNDSYYSITFNSNGYKFYGLDVEPSIAAAGLFVESNLTVSAYEIQYASASISSNTETFVSAIEIQHALISVSGLSVSVVLALEEQRARIAIDIESNAVIDTMKDAYARASLSGDLTAVSSPIEIQYASSSVSFDAECTPTAIEILYADPVDQSIESEFTSNATRVRVVSCSLSIETSVNVGAYKFARALIDNIIDAQLTATAYKETFATIAIDVDCDVQPRAIEIQYAYPDAMASELDATIRAIEILFTGSIVSFESDATVTAYEIQLGKADLSIEGYTLTVAQEILYPEIAIDITSDAQVTAYKIAYSECSLSIESDMSVTAYEIQYARQDIDVESELVADGTKIAYAAADLSVEGYTVTVGKEILFARISVAFSTNVLFVTPLRFSDNIVEDTQVIRTLLLLDDKPLTEHNRTFTSLINPSFIETTNWKNSRNRYYKKSSGRKTFSITWSYVPNNRENTVDLKFGRDMINRIANDPDIHTLRYLNIDSDGTNPYSEEQVDVVVKNYSEKLVRRDIDNDVYFWDCSLELEEV